MGNGCKRNTWKSKTDTEKSEMADTGRRDKAKIPTSIEAAAGKDKKERRAISWEQKEAEV